VTSSRVSEDDALVVGSVHVFCDMARAMHSNRGMRWMTALMLAPMISLGCSSGGTGDAPPTSSYDCTGQKATSDIPSRNAAESLCVDVRRAGRFCHVCVQSIDSSGTELSYTATETADPCGCPQAKIVAAPCKACSDPGLTGVKVCVSADTCTFKSGVGGTFRYEVTVDDSAPVLHTAENGPGCATCASWSADPLSFVSWNIGGGDVRYCLCDTGCCAPQPAKTITLDRGTKSATIEWPGRQWDGPSDTGAPLGAPFPAGSYSVAVTFSGAKEGTLTATLPITVVP
jgi:hypothetical protein